MSCGEFLLTIIPILVAGAIAGFVIGNLLGYYILSFPQTTKLQETEVLELKGHDHFEVENGQGHIEIYSDESFSVDMQGDVIEASPSYLPTVLDPKKDFPSYIFVADFAEGEYQLISTERYLSQYVMRVEPLAGRTANADQVTITTSVVRHSSLLKAPFSPQAMTGTAVGPLAAIFIYAVTMTILQAKNKTAEPN